MERPLLYISDKSVFWHCLHRFTSVPFYLSLWHIDVKSINLQINTDSNWLHMVTLRFRHYNSINFVMSRAESD